MTPTFFRPRLQELEDRWAPAVAVQAFASIAGGAVDSYCIIGTPREDEVSIIADPGGAGFFVEANDKALTLPALDTSEPAEVRINLGGDQDTVRYVIPNPVVLQRRLRIRDALDLNRFYLNNQ